MVTTRREVDVIALCPYSSKAGCRYGGPVWEGNSVGSLPAKKMKDRKTELQRIHPSRHLPSLFLFWKAFVFSGFMRSTENGEFNIFKCEEFCFCLLLLVYCNWVCTRWQ
jgi:hypothetical protein